MRILSKKSLKKKVGRGFLTWVGRVTGNDNIFLLGLMYMISEAERSCFVRIFWRTIGVKKFKSYIQHRKAVNLIRNVLHGGLPLGKQTFITFMDASIYQY